jgi:CRP/FNR family transcriptional regulator, dissimilatory nitrate respiration regulator
MAEIDIHALLRHQPMFQALSDAQLSALLPHTVQVRGRKGDVVFRKGDPCDGMFLVVFGRVKLSMFSSHGIEKVLEIVEPGQSFADAVMFLGYPCPVTAGLLEDSLLLRVAAPAIFAAIESEADFARKLLAGMAMRLHGLVRDVERYSVESASQRVCGYLLRDLAGAEGSEGVVSLPVNKNLIASRLNLSPETFSRVLQRLSAAGMIRVSGREITVLDVTGLRDFAGRDGTT